MHPSVPALGIPGTDKCLNLDMAMELLQSYLDSWPHPAVEQVMHRVLRSAILSFKLNAWRLDALIEGQSFCKKNALMVYLFSYGSSLAK